MKIMNKTEIFKDYNAFLKRTDKSVNGVTDGFIENMKRTNPNYDYQQDNQTNIGCFCCYNCEKCKECNFSRHCMDCEKSYCINHCVNCVDCVDCFNCVACVGCEDSYFLDNRTEIHHLYNVEDSSTKKKLPI